MTKQAAPVVLSLLLLPHIAQAQGPAIAPASAPPDHDDAAKPAKVLPPLIITATRDGEEWLTSPHTVHQLSAQQWEERLVRNLPEALRELPGVHVQKTSNGQGSPFIRGFTGFRTLALIDGVRFNNSTFREGPNQYWSTLDPLSLSRLELVPGHGGVLYGSDAIGGTLNAFTKDSGWRDGTGLNGGLLSYRGSTAESSHGLHFEANTGDAGKWGLHIGGSVREFGDVDAADIGRQPKTGYDEWAYDLRFDAAINDQWTFTAVHQQLRQDDVWRTHATIFGRPWHGTTIGNDRERSFDQERTLSYVRLAGDKLEGFADSISFTASWQTADEWQHRIRSNGASDDNDVFVDTLGFDLQFTSDTSIGKLTYGADYYRDGVDSLSTFFNANGTFNRYGIQGPVGDDSTYDLLGVFIQDEIAVSDRATLFLGGRYTRATADVGRYQDPVTNTAASLEDDWSRFTGSARFVIDLDAEKTWKLYGGISQGFRAPNLSDLTRLDIARSGELETAAPGLDPEEYLNFEIGARTRHDRHSASLTYFHTRIDDMIVRRPTGNMVNNLTEVTKANAGDGFVHGVELAGDYRLNDNWSVFGWVTWTEGEVDQFPTSGPALAREPLSRVIPLIGHAGLRYKSDTEKWWVELAATAASKADKLNTGDRADTQRIPPGGTPGYTYLTLRGGCKLSENVSVTASLDNILDEDWRSHGSGSNEPGFGGTLGVTLTF
jgi:hemoglobin/transferrin/lactoferrin receptor protein